MPRFKAGMVMIMLGAAAVFSAAVTSSACAGSWFIKGTRLASGATVAIANTAQVDESTDLNAPSLGIRLTCSGGISRETNPYIQGDTSFGAESVALTGCSEIAPSTCSIKTEIETEPIVGSFETAGSLDRVRFAPERGQTLATLEFHGTCAFAGEQSINGRYVMESETGQTESVLAPLEGMGTTENNSLELFKDKAYIVGGKALLKLVSGLTWSFH